MFRLQKSFMRFFFLSKMLRSCRKQNPNKLRKCPRDGQFCSSFYELGIKGANVRKVHGVHGWQVKEAGESKVGTSLGLGGKGQNREAHGVTSVGTGQLIVSVRSTQSWYVGNQVTMSAVCLVLWCRRLCLPGLGEENYWHFKAMLSQMHQSGPGALRVKIDLCEGRYRPGM